MLNLKLIWAKQKPSNDELIVKTKINEIPQFNCFAATNHKTGNHLFFIELSNHAVVPDFKKLKFKGVRIEVFKFEKKQQLNIYLIDIELKDIFTLFIENIINELLDLSTENEALITISNVIQKWRKLFDKISPQGLTIEQQKGLLGELLILSDLISSELNIDNIFSSWTGPEFEDKDFTFGAICFEIKFTTSKLPRIKITSERQLDTSNIDRLFLNNYIAENIKEKGISLNSIVDMIRQKLSNNAAILKLFNEKLELANYFDEHRDNYNSQYGIKSSSLFHVSGNFPKLTANIIPQGIYNTSYYIETSAINDYKVEFKTVIKSFKNE